jgi:hypothetical protein
MKQKPTFRFFAAASFIALFLLYSTITNFLMHNCFKVPNHGQLKIPIHDLSSSNMSRVLRNESTSQSNVSDTVSRESALLESNAFSKCGNVDRIFVISMRNSTLRQNMTLYLWETIRNSSRCELPEIRFIPALKIPPRGNNSAMANISTLEKLKQHGWKGPAPYLSMGQIGVYITHYHLWLHISLNYPNQTVLIAEDDQDGYSYSMNMFHEILLGQKLPSGWDILWLAGTQSENPNPDARVSMNVFQDLPKTDFWGTWVYMLSSAGLRRLLQLHRESMAHKMYNAIDILNLGYVKGGKLSTYFILPKLFTHMERRVVGSDVPGSGFIRYNKMKMVLEEALEIDRAEAKKNSNASLAPFHSKAASRVVWEEPDARCWDLLFSASLAVKSP